MFAAVGCGKAQQDVVEIDPAFQSYLADFLHEGAAHGRTIEVKSLKIQFGATKSASERAFCVHGGDSVPTITVNQQSWNNSTDAEKENTIFHELGHCLLNQGHRSGVDAFGLPVSLINPYKLDPTVYEDHRDDLIGELFSN
jgi:hypothetical protein